MVLGSDPLWLPLALESFGAPDVLVWLMITACHHLLHSLGQVLLSSREQRGSPQDVVVDLVALHHVLLLELLSEPPILFR